MAIGEILSETREKMGLSLEDVEEATKIRRKYVKALEDNNFEIIPGKVYVRGFLRNYARFLSLDGEKLVHEYNEIIKDQMENIDPPQETIISKTEKTGKRNGKYWAIVAAVILVGFIYLLGSSYAGLQNKLSENGKSPKSTDNPSYDGTAPGDTGPKKPENNPSNEVPLTGMDVVLQVTDSECWMRIIVDDKNAFEGMVGPGSVKTFKGEESVQLKLGNAGAVKVMVNGKDYGFLGAPGQVITRAFQVGNTG
ncbi:helix-turn-helix domain-containing protein [Desulfotruncus alcoholivorax]|uniref:helix-turn-helix domain-containing protein n=1 Tax=Desulfotruncus alcoholivorax TaxID=265477 RepID=UPI000425505F|nr:RodZ domain-containing protein [Desulfotruncus alcoholivorax]